MSLSRSCPKHSVLHRQMHVCVKGSTKAKLDTLSPCVSLSLILSSLQTQGIRPTVLKAAVWIEFPPRVWMCVYVCEWNTHTLQNVDAGNGSGREWGEMKGNWGFFYHHSLSSCTDTPCVWAYWRVSNMWMPHITSFLLSCETLQNYNCFSLFSAKRKLSCCQPKLNVTVN